MEKGLGKPIVQPAEAPDGSFISKGHPSQRPGGSTSLRGLFRYATARDRVIVFTGCIASLAYGLCQPLSMIVNGQFIDSTGAFSVTEVSTLVLYYVYLAIAIFVAGTLQMVCLGYVAERIALEVRVAFFESALKHDATFYDLHGSSAGLNAITSANVPQIRAAVGSKLGMALQGFSLVVASFVIGFYYAWQVALTVLASVPLLGFGGYFYASRSAAYAKLELEVYASAGAIIEEAIQSIRTVTAYSLHQHFSVRLRSSLAAVTTLGTTASLVTALCKSSLTAAYHFSYPAAYYIGALVVANDRTTAAEEYPVSSPPPLYQCATGQVIPLQCSTQRDQNLTFLTINDVCSCALCNCGCFYPDGIFHPERCLTGGNVLLVFFSVIFGGVSLGYLIPNVQAILYGKQAAGKMYQVIDSAGISSGLSSTVEKDSSETDTVSPDSPISKRVSIAITLDELKGEIEFKGVSFAYPARPDVKVFSDLSVKIPAGCRVALCGSSGSGKSSIVALLLRFYDIHEGNVLIDGHDIMGLDIAWLRSRIGLVSQEPTLFAGVTIRENIRYGKPSATDQEIEAACRHAYAHEFITSFPDAYDTVVTGSSFSGGQRQRICIARALVRDPTILILDEASAALDPESERMVNESVDRIIRETKRTVLVIAHRLSTIQTCERIVMLGEGGRIIEQGSHSELMTLNGAFAAMNAPTKKLQLYSSENPRSLTSLPEKHSPQEPDIGEEEESDGDEIAGEEPVVVADNEKDFEKDSGSFSKLFHRFAYSERFVLLAGMFGTGVSGANEALTAFTFSRIIPAMFYMNNADLLHAAAVYALVFLGLALNKGWASLLNNWAFGYLGAKITSKVRAETFDHMIRQEVGFFDDPKNNAASLISKLTKDAAMVKSSIGGVADLYTCGLSSTLAALIVAFFGSWKLTLVVLVMLPLMFLGNVVDYIGQAGGLWKDEASANAESAAARTFGEAISGYKTVSAFNLQSVLVRAYREQLQVDLSATTRGVFVKGASYGLAQSIQYFVYALTFHYSSVLVGDGEATLQSILQSVLPLIFVAHFIGFVSASNADVIKGKAAVRSIFEILDRKSKIDPFDASGKKPSSLMGDLALDDVNFTYSTRRGVPVLKNVSFSIPRGSILALVGESGSGKSTIISLLERFYDVSSGRILLDGNPLPELNIDWLRAHIGLVSQEPTLFDDTIFNNIKMGACGLEQMFETDVAQLVEQAAKDSNAYDFIMELPEKFETRCGQKGSHLSGGQKQRIAIARALIRDPDILLCDEATSALDEESQRNVQDAIDRLLEAKKRTVIIIAHRLSTVQRADNVLVLRKGLVVEHGSYQELSEREGGKFRAMLLAQQNQIQSATN